MHQEIPADMDGLAKLVVDSAFKVHATLGPGLLESAYQQCMQIELTTRGVEFEAQKALSIVYQGIEIPGAFKVDLLVKGALLIELKAVESLLPIHRAQTLTYLRLSGLRLGLLINFNTALIKDGIKRIVN
jgi:GxxExxY protein